MSAPLHRREEGSATLWALSLVLVVWAVTLAGLVLGAGLVARHRAESAADLAALSAARAVHSAAGGGPAGEPCTAAAEVAGAAGARLVGCRVEPGGDVWVVTEVPPPAALPGWADMPPARARARAGVGLAEG